MRRRDMHVGEDKWREHEKDIQGSSGFEDKGYIWPHKLVSDQKIQIFLQLKDVQVYQIAIHPCTKNSSKKFNRLVIYELAFAPSSWLFEDVSQNVLATLSKSSKIRWFPASFWRIHAYFGPSFQLPRNGLPFGCEANPTTWRAPEILTGQSNGSIIGWWLGCGGSKEFLETMCHCSIALLKSDLGMIMFQEVGRNTGGCFHICEN